jgi:transcriptional regulator GlxA family with amidase domain
VARRYDPEPALLTSVYTGSWVYGRMGLLDGLPATNRKEPDRLETVGGITSGMEMGFHLLRRAGYSDEFVDGVARVMEYAGAYDLYRDDVETVG